jgi:hypothetical protein
MSRIDYRGGKSPIRTAEELVSLLTLPLYLLVVGKSDVLFPSTDRSNPSVSVGIRSFYPPKEVVWIHWTQWESVVVPITSDDRIREWRHQLGSGDFEELSRLSVGFLYSCDLSASERLRPGSKNSEYIDNLGGIILSKATEAGY